AEVVSPQRERGERLFHAEALGPALARRRHFEGCGRVLGAPEPAGDLDTQRIELRSLRGIRRRRREGPDKMGAGKLGGVLERGPKPLDIEPIEHTGDRSFPSLAPASLLTHVLCLRTARTNRHAKKGALVSPPQERRSG